MDTSDILKARVTITFIVDNLISQDALDEEYGGDLFKFVNYLEEQDGIISLIDDEVEIISVVKI